MSAAFTDDRLLQLADTNSGTSAAGEGRDSGASMLARQAQLRSVLRRLPPGEVRALLRRTPVWTPINGAGGADGSAPAWRRDTRDLPEHVLRSRGQVHHSASCFQSCDWPSPHVLIHFWHLLQMACGTPLPHQSFVNVHR